MNAKSVFRNLAGKQITLLLLTGLILLYGKDIIWARNGEDIIQANNLNKKIMIGMASWYSKNDKTDRWPHKFNADGSPFNEDALTCATRDREFGRYYKVTNLASGKSVIVLKRDFGPGMKYKGKKLNRIIDLSKAAFSKIADLNSGVVSVKVEAVAQQA